MKLSSQMGKIHEYAAELDARKGDYEKLIGQYDALIDVVKASDRQDEFPDDFVESLEQVRENAKTQLEHLHYRVGYAKAILDMWKENNGLVDQIVTLMFNIFGVDVSAPESEAEEG